MTTLSPSAVARELFLGAATASGSIEFHGDSMLPLLRDGDRLAVQAVAWDEICAGDIIVHRFDDRFPALRIVEKLADKLFLKADNWPAPIFEAWREDVLGRVAGSRRDGRDVGRSSRAWRRAAIRAVAEYRLRDLAGRGRARARSLTRRVRADAAALGAGMIGMPEAFQLNVSSVCNLTCRMCPYLGVHQNDSYQTFMTPETFERLLPAIRGIDAVLFSGSGEPLYNPHLLSFLARVREERPSIRIGMTTNGTLLRREVAEELVRLRLDTLKVSIDGATAATVQAIRRNSDFARIVDNVEQLSRVKRERGSGLPRILANYMTGYGTYGEIPDFVRLAARIGIEEVHLLDIQPSCHDDVRDSLTVGIRRDQGHGLRYAIQVGQRLGVSIHLPAVTKGACLFPYHPHIAENGDVYPCCFLDYDGRTLFDGRRKTVLPPLSFGNSISRGFRAVWNSREYRLFRRRTKSGDFPATCTTCYDIRASTASEVVRVIGPRPRQPGR